MDVILGKCHSHFSNCRHQCKSRIDHADIFFDGSANTPYSWNDYYDYFHKKVFNRSAANAKYKLNGRIGNGAFGMIYEGVCMHDEERRVAIKIERKS